MSSWARSNGGGKDSARCVDCTPPRDSITELIVPAAGARDERACDNRKRDKCHMARK
jgi:hypothetical protein